MDVEAEAEEDEREREQFRYDRDAGPLAIPPPVGDVERGYAERETEGTGLTPPRRTKGFVGGFFAELKRIPAFMTKNSPRGPEIAPDGSGPSPRLSYYSSASPSVHGSPLPSQATQSQYRPSTVPIEELYESEHSDAASQSQLPYDDQYRSEDYEDQNRNENYDGTTAVHDPLYEPYPDPSVMSSPQQVRIEDLNDYEKTNTPYPFTNPEDKTLASYVDRLHRVLTDIYYLPWMSLQVATEYIPVDDSSRGRYRKGPPVSWYSPRHRKEKPQIDLMASPATFSPPPMIQTIPPTPTLSGLYSSHYSHNTRSPVPSDARLTLTASQYTYAPTHTQRSHSRAPSESGATAFRELRSPGVATTVSGMAPSPGASSHGLGRHSISESFHYASPRNYPAYPSVASALSTPPQARLGSEYLSPKY